MAPKGKGKTSWNTWPQQPWPQQPKPALPAYVPPPPAPGKGKGTKGPKGKGKGKPGQQSNWPAEYATTDARGKQYCRLHILSNACQGNCGRSHQCPVLKTDGTACNGNHAVASCPAR